MAKALRKLVALSLGLSVLILPILPAYSCGPFFPYAVYAYRNHPDLPLRKFAEGNIGILQPTLARSYLVIAYRYFTDRPLDKDEQAAAVRLCDSRPPIPQG